MRSGRAAFLSPLFTAAATIVVVMAGLAVLRWNLWTYGSDTGTFAQVISNAFHGFRDNLETGGAHFRTHWSPILAVLWPLVSLTRSPLSIQIAQVVLISACAFPLAAIVRPYADEKWATRCGVLALLYPPLLANAFAEFHELAFYPLFVLVLLWAADRARWLWFGLSAVALALVREDACVDLVVIGITLAIMGSTRRTTNARGLLLGEPIEPERLAVGGTLLALFSACALGYYWLILLPRIGPWTPSHFYQYPFANGPVQTALAVFTHPFSLLHAIATRGRLTYMLEAVVPLALLPFFTRWSLLALPAFAGILLSSDQSVWRMGMHYVLLWAPFLLLAAAWALVRIHTRRSERTAVIWWRTAIALCIVFLVAFNPMHPAHYLQAQPYQHTADARRAFSCIPRDAPIATHDEWFAHEALAYPGVGVFGDRPDRFSGYLVFAADWKNAHFTQVLPLIRQAQRRGAFALACSYGTVQVLRSTTLRTAR